MKIEYFQVPINNAVMPAVPHPCYSDLMRAVAGAVDETRQRGVVIASECEPPDPSIIEPIAKDAMGSYDGR